MAGGLGTRTLNKPHENHKQDCSVYECACGQITMGCGPGYWSQGCSSDNNLLNKIICLGLFSVFELYFTIK